MNTLVDFALGNSGCEARYHSRLASYPDLAKFGCLPENFSDISNNESPWFCHGLAFRMATYSNDYFARWEALFNKARQADGWDNEYNHWKNTGDHWAKKWDKFHHFLWVLQCYEYFSERGHDVSFPAVINPRSAMPDMLISRQGQANVYVECLNYSKWWPQEHFVEELLHYIDPNLVVKRIHNVNLSNNPFSNEKFGETLELLAVELTPERLAALRILAATEQPQPVCQIGGVQVSLEGRGNYLSDPNAHGDPSFSWPIFEKEIIKAKENSNNLKNCRPNLVLVNGLGLDFQLSIPEAKNLELPCSIDEIWIFTCGINSKLGDGSSVKKVSQKGYDGSGL